MVDYRILFGCFIGGVCGADFYSCEFVINFNSLPSLFQNIINRQYHHYFTFGVALTEELVGAHFGAIPKHVTKDETDAFVEYFIWLIFDVFVSVHSLRKPRLNTTSKTLTGSKHQMMNDL